MLVVLLYSVLALLGSWLYFGRYRLQRPPIGVFNLWDVGAMLAGIVVIPYLYLLLPTGLVVSLLGLAALSMGYFCLEPVVQQRWQGWAIVLLLGASNLGAHYWDGAPRTLFWALHNLLQIIVVVGITNLWVQSGMKARDIALMGGLLIGYDYLFTTVLPLMDNLFRQVGHLPFAPLVAWQTAAGQWVAIGLGDLLMAAVFPLVLRKAYGRAMGQLALGLALGTLAVVMYLAATGLFQETLPLMVILGPLMVLQYGLWRWQCGHERTMVQYWQASTNVDPVRLRLG